MVTITSLNDDNRRLLDHVADGVFDCEINPRSLQQFMSDPCHHLVVAVDAGLVVGMASGVHYVHPDKDPELWINEVGVAPTHQNQGVGRQLVQALLVIGRQLRCKEAWVLTDRSNEPAMRMYASCGGSPAPRDQVMFTFKLG